MATSAAIESVLDRAKSEARRFGCEVISAIHVISGARRWREEQFDQRYSGILASLSQALEKSRGNSIATPTLDPDLVAATSKIASMDELWEFIDVLVESAKLGGTTDSDSDYIPKSSVSNVHNGNNSESDNSPSLKFADSIPLGVAYSLAERVSKVTGRNETDVLTTMLCDVAWIFGHVVGSSDSDAINEMFHEFQAELPKINIPSDISMIVSDINVSKAPNSNRLASQVAFFYADVAEWFAALDDKFEVAEIERIDNLKELLIAQLDGVVDAEVEATLNFEAKFSGLIGMNDVKNQIRKFVDMMVIQRRRERRGMKVEPQRLHLAFLGNPGTGKTTVARLYGELLHELGIMTTKNFHEVAGTDFTSFSHLGESEQAMSKAVNDALNGVLFIDEAYAMNDPYNDNMRGPGLRATDVLVKKMEDHRDQLCVIVAGYTIITNEYLQCNPGMPSRIGAFIEFSDYTTDEIRQMVPVIAKKRNLLIDEKVVDQVVHAVEATRDKPDFGNARSVEKVLEECERNCTTRVSKMGSLATERMLRTIEADDVPRIAPTYKKQFGFVSRNQPGYI